MLNKLGGNNFIKNFAKTIIGITLGIGFLGVVTKVYAYQIVDLVKVISVGCYSHTCTLTIDRDHPYTKYDPVRKVGTEYCVKRTFAWNKNQYPDFLRLAEKAHDQGRLVRLRYSEYRCYDASSEGGDKYMSLGRIELH